MKKIIIALVCASLLVSCNSPERVSQLTREVDNLHAVKTDGIYIIDKEIASGTWQITGNNQNCYWSVYSECGNFLESAYGSTGVKLNIRADGFQVEFKNCGRLEFVSNP
jgi:hypothetical protein